MISPKFKTDLLIVALIFLAASVWLLAGISNQHMWQDEAQTACLAKTIISHGVPLGYDGKNFFSQELGKEYGRDYVWRWYPWLSLYVLAPFLYFLGDTTFAARLPFALFGAATVALAYLMAKSLWQSRRAGLLAALVLVLNVPFLILSRQCRYYAPSMFFTLLSLYSCYGLIERRKRSGLVFVLSSIALFHTNYLYYAALLGSAFLYCALFHRSRLKALLAFSGITVLVNAPWIIWFSPLLNSISAVSAFAVRDYGLFFREYLRQIGSYIFPPLLLLALPVLWAAGRMLHEKMQASGTDAHSWKKTALLLLFSAATIAAVSLTTPYPFFRYIAPVIPVACLITALILDRAASAHRIAGPVAVGLILILLGSLWSVPDYIHEITHNYKGPIDGIVEYLQKHANKGDVVAITYGDMPVKFYTGLRVVGGLTGEDLTPAKNADWVIIRRHVICEKDMRVRKFLLTELPLGKYDPIVLNYPDLPFENREDPAQHLFRTAKDYPVVLFHRRMPQVRLTGTAN